MATAALPDGRLAAESSKSVGGTLKAETAPAVLHTSVLFSNSLSVPKRKITLHFVVRDNVNGRIGSVVVPDPVR